MQSIWRIGNFCLTYGIPRCAYAYGKGKQKQKHGKKKIFPFLFSVYGKQADTGKPQHSCLQGRNIVSSPKNNRQKTNEKEGK